MEFIFKEDYVLVECENYPPFVIDYDTYNGRAEDKHNTNVCYMINEINNIDDPDDWEQH